ncbi:MAG: hypothetical protein GXY83_18345 [Rhodopirellula sp.]|nr:hypothetical protein [Rhodopirellula sp.]
MSRTPLICLTIVVLWQPVLATADEGSTPGEIRKDSTPNSISIEWNLTGDTDHDATCSVQYRQQGSDKWLEALPLFRVDYQWWYHTERADKPLNLFAGSLMFLEPGKTYEVRLDLADPDGGTATKTASVATRPIPKLPQGGRTLHVVPGAGGGSGTADDPFQGMKTAQEAAKPGDIMLLHQGDYGSFAFEKPGEPEKYLVWKAAGDGEALFSAIRVNGSHLWLVGLHLKRREEPNGLRASDRTADVVIRGCQFDGFHYSITLKPTSRYWHITDNVIVGDNDPNQPTNEGGISGEGVELSHSEGHVVAYNRISRVADGVSYPQRNVDIYNNDIFDVSDDGLEPDYGFANVRMWENRITNAKNYALSFQPMKCGPWYFVRNLVIGRGIFKFRVQDRFVLVNNTFITWGSIGDRMHHILTSFSRNNLYISADGAGPIWAAYDCNQPQYCLPNNYEPTWMTNVDYDGFDWGSSPEAFRWNSGRQRFKDLPSFAEAVGIERHGIRVRKEDFANWSVPAELARVNPQHLPLKAGSEAVDAGVVVPSISDQFSGKAPDLGAYEFGGEVPHYGPRRE